MPSQIEKISLKNPFDHDNVAKISHVPPPYRLKSRNPEPKIAEHTHHEKSPKKEHPEQEQDNGHHHGGKNFNTGLKLDVDA